MKTWPRITPDWLREHHACEEGIRWFKEIFGDGQYVSLAAIRVAIGEDVDVPWFVAELSRMPRLTTADNLEWAETIEEYAIRALELKT